MSERSQFVTFILLVVVAGVVLFILAMFTVYEVNGLSMAPELSDKEHVIVYEGVPDQLRRGEVILYQQTGNTLVGVKRIIGLPGEKITIGGGAVFVNDEILEESYLSDGMQTCVPVDCSSNQQISFEVPVGAYFVLGDNRTVSRDSRECHGDTLCSEEMGRYVSHSDVQGRILTSLPSWLSTLSTNP